MVVDAVEVGSHDGSMILTRSVVLVVFDGLQPLDLVGPHEVFAAANGYERSCGRPEAYRLRVCAATPGPVRSSSGLGVVADHALPSDQVDTVVVAGGAGARVVPPEGLVTWLRASRARRVASVCTGAFLLAAAGLLDGRRATTHWAHAQELQSLHPGVRVDPDPLFVQDGQVWTSAGVTAGIDLALALVEADLGVAAAQAVARSLVLFLRRSGGQSQFAAEVWTDPPERAVLRELVRHIHAEPGADLRVPVLARRASMSPRHLQRTFSSEVGEGVAGYVNRVRVDAARRLLEQEPVTVTDVARRCGFGTAEAMRRAFHRQLGVSPDAYRDRYSHPFPLVVEERS